MPPKIESTLLNVEEVEKHIAKEGLGAQEMTSVFLTLWKELAQTLILLSPVFFLQEDLNTLEPFLIIIGHLKKAEQLAANIPSFELEKSHKSTLLLSNEEHPVYALKKKLESLMNPNIKAHHNVLLEAFALLKSLQESLLLLAPSMLIDNSNASHLHAHVLNPLITFITYLKTFEPMLLKNPFSNQISIEQKGNEKTLAFNVNAPMGTKVKVAARYGSGKYIKGFHNKVFEITKLHQLIQFKSQSKKEDKAYLVLKTSLTDLHVQKTTLEFMI
jgi:hypothetical protein